MIDIQVNNGIAEVNDFEGSFDSVEYVDDNFVHLTISDTTFGITPSNTTINGVHYASVELFINALTTN